VIKMTIVNSKKPSLQINDRIIGENHPPLVIVEIGVIPPINNGGQR
jgi:hypothetical protein